MNYLKQSRSLGKSHPPRPSRRRGSSVVIGNLLILMASVMMATVVLYWALSFQGGAQSSYSTAIFQSNAQAGEQVSIDDVRFDNTTKRVTVYVRNFGDIPLKVKQVYIDGVALNPPDPQDNVIVSRQSGTVTAEYSNWWFAGDTHVIRVATERGNQYERSFPVPK